MTTLAFLVSALLVSASPLARYATDRRESDGYRYTSWCVGLYQQPSTWTCVEVAR